MALKSLWETSPGELDDKHLKQIIGFAGSGSLSDGNEASVEFREFLSLVHSHKLKAYTEDCLKESFQNSGFALQDIVNEVGRRLEFEVENGRYRGKPDKPGYDGIWTGVDGYTYIIEVKTSDTYQINLDTVANYRRSLIKNEHSSEEGSSILIVVGRENTGGIEAQIRGSKHAWDIRLISVDALFRLLKLKEELENPETVTKIRKILAPREYTRVDDIIDLAFSAVEGIKEDEFQITGEEIEESASETSVLPVSFHDECVSRIQLYLGKNLLKRSRVFYSSADGSLALVCAVSKEYRQSDDVSYYWYGFYPHQREKLAKSDNSLVAFGCGSAKKILLIPFEKFSSFVDGMHITYRDTDKFYWHVIIYNDIKTGTYNLRRKKTEELIDITEHLLK